MEKKDLANSLKQYFEEAEVAQFKRDIREVWLRAITGLLAILAWEASKWWSGV